MLQSPMPDTRKRRMLKKAVQRAGLLEDRGVSAISYAGADARPSHWLHTMPASLVAGR